MTTTQCHAFRTALLTKIILQGDILPVPFNSLSRMVSCGTSPYLSGIMTGQPSCVHRMERTCPIIRAFEYGLPFTPAGKRPCDENTSYLSIIKDSTMRDSYPTWTIVELVRMCQNWICLSTLVGTVSAILAIVGTFYVLGSQHTSVVSHRKFIVGQKR